MFLAQTDMVNDMAKYSMVSEYVDKHGRFWRSYATIKATSLYNAINKHKKLLNKIGINPNKIGVYVEDGSTGVHFIGDSGNLMAVGRDSEKSGGYCYSHRMHIVNGEIKSISDLHLNEHQWVVSRVALKF